MSKQQEFTQRYRVSLYIRFNDGDNTLETVQTEAQATGAKGSKPPALVGNPDRTRGEAFGDTAVVTGIEPMDFTLERNGFYEEDTLRLSFAFQDCPIDPSIVRAMRVELYGAPSETVDMNPSRRLLFQGYVDSPQASLYRDERDTLTIKARDYQGILMDTPVEANHYISLGGDMAAAEFTALLLNGYTAFADLKVDWVGDAGSARLPKLGDKKQHRKESVWDYLMRRLLSVGVIPYLWHDDGEPVIWLVKTSDAYSQNRFGWNSHDAGRESALDIYTGPVFVAGYNCRNVEIEKELGRRSAVPIEVRCVRPKDQAVCVGAYPPVEWREKHPERVLIDSGDTAPRIVEVAYPAGSGDDSRFAIETELYRLARELFWAHSLHELTVSFDTNDTCSYGMLNTHGDVFWLVPGDPINLLRRESDRADISDTQAKIMKMTELELARYLVGRGYSEQVAQVIARSIKRGLPYQYYLRRLIVDFDGEQTTISIHASDFITGSLNPDGLDGITDTGIDVNAGQNIA